MAGDKWIIMSSDSQHNLNYYPDNKPYKFTSHLEQPLTMDGSWYITLRELFAKRTGSRKKSKEITDDILYVYCSLAEMMTVNGEQKPLLRRIKATKPNTWISVINDPYFMNTRFQNTTLDQISVYITDVDDNLATYLHEPVTLTLQLKRYPFV
jgi:hypothetical protein